MKGNILFSKKMYTGDIAVFTKRQEEKRRNKKVDDLVSRSPPFDRLRAAVKPREASFCGLHFELSRSLAWTHLNHMWTSRTQLTPRT